MPRPAILDLMLAKQDTVEISDEKLRRLDDRCFEIMKRVESYIGIAKKSPGANGHGYGNINKDIDFLIQNYSSISTDTKKIKEWSYSNILTGRNSISADEFINLYEMVIKNLTLADQLKRSNLSSSLTSIASTLLITMAETDTVTFYNEIWHEVLLSCLNDYSAQNSIVVN